jgi:hypothetical protein
MTILSPPSPIATAQADESRLRDQQRLHHDCKWIIALFQFSPPLSTVSHLLSGELELRFGSEQFGLVFIY